MLDGRCWMVVDGQWWPWSHLMTLNGVKRMKRKKLKTK